MLFSEYIKSEPIIVSIDLYTDFEDIESIRKYFSEIERAIEKNEYYVQND